MGTIQRLHLHGTMVRCRQTNDSQVLERGKQSVLRKHSKGSTEEPHWHEEIASDAEAFVSLEYWVLVQR